MNLSTAKKLALNLMRRHGLSPAGGNLDDYFEACSDPLTRRYVLAAIKRMDRPIGRAVMAGDFTGTNIDGLFNPPLVELLMSKPQKAI